MTMTVALVFPGQGSQSLGMLNSVTAEHPVVRATVDEASAVLGYDLWERIASGPEALLNATECTQPAMLVAGVATYRLWQALGGAAPALVAGHSLGEFTALVCAGVLGYAEAVALVRQRGALMQAAVPAGSGAMAAILGLDDAAVEAACAEAAAGEVVEAVNYNAPGQIVIAGQTAAVERAVGLAKAAGAKRAVTLPVSVPAHSSLMRGAAAQLSGYLDKLSFGTPTCIFVSAVDAQAHHEAADIRALLVRQLASPVRWSQTVQALCARGAQALYECGPGKVLTALNKRIAPRDTVSCAALVDGPSIRAALAGPQSTGG
ncbi:MAG: ACP S-malonyltransferase [Steroidobacteraceae bacterium]|jgi:[acyl-carrier-protein] S-malonyltransferase